MFTRTITIEEKCRGIRANALTPSLVHSTESTERITSGAALAPFLCSSEVARLTGQAISAHGGISAA